MINEKGLTPDVAVEQPDVEFGQPAPHDRCDARQSDRAAEERSRTRRCARLVGRRSLRSLLGLAASLARQERRRSARAAVSQRVRTARRTSRDARQSDERAAASPHERASESRAKRSSQLSLVIRLTRFSRSLYNRAHVRFARARHAAAHGQCPLARGSGGQMNKQELIAKVAKDTGGTKSIGSTGDRFGHRRHHPRAEEGRLVTFVGFGTFKTSNRKARTARNPQTGAASRSPSGRPCASSPAKRSRPPSTERRQFRPTPGFAETARPGVMMPYAILFVRLFEKRRTYRRVAQLVRAPP